LPYSCAILTPRFSPQFARKIASLTPEVLEDLRPQYLNRAARAGYRERAREQADATVLGKVSIFYRAFCEKTSMAPLASGFFKACL
jgi:hypothetical protein